MTFREYTEDYEVRHTHMGRPHVVLLGAGASYAAFPDGDKFGQVLPLLRDFVEVLGLGGLLEQAGVERPWTDFEAIYSEIALDPSRANIRERIDQRVYGYFGGLSLPEEPTLYDHLILSLRAKDVVATFNWDPFLWNACHRNRHVGGLPSILYLHGSVAIAQCDSCKIVRSRSVEVCTCGTKLKPIPILFPVTKKNYNSDPVIAAHWRNLSRALTACYAFTIFGYSAPKTDVEAIALLQEAWGSADDRELEEIEIIDIQEEDSLRDAWNDFIHSHHYTVKRSFYESFIAEHPRRSCEAIWSQNMDCMFLEPFPLPRNADFESLYEWLEPRVEVERAE